MFNRKNLITVLLFLGTSITSLFAILGQVYSADSVLVWQAKKPLAKQLLAQRRRPPRPPTPGGGEVYQELVNQAKKEESPATRGVRLCPLSPGVVGINDTFSDRPLFLWQGGNIQRVELRRPGGDQILWEQKLPPGDSKVIYEAQPLQVGQTYQWSLYNSANDYVRFIFRIMDETQRQEIAAELAEIEKSLKEQNATPEQIAVAKAEYFAAQRLWSDALREIYLVENPSPALTKTAQEITNQLCRNSI
ncbi:DUF928 domain-containing protein [Aerosakkonemataceae cyanobacterium BLCC-F154]|uniref:DUF928 domain-containing protein n=1 Tax=Floridaenema fluviatile BLCC-F154 TaxID=3153640 RepID=A0ABV4YJR5_9CYAN